MFGPGPCSRYRRCTAVFVSLAAFAAAPPWPALRAAGPSPGVAPLTLEEALRLAEQASPLVRRAHAEHQVVVAREVGASLLMPANPLIVGGVGPRRERTGPIDERGLQYFAHAEQMVEIGGQRSARREVVSKARRTAELRVEVARAETRARVRAAYVGTQLALARVDAATEREALVAKLLEAVRARVAGGASSNVDLELARLERGSAARARIDATLAATDALARLRLLVGLPPGQKLEVERRTLPPAARGETLPGLLARAQAQRAELAALASGVEEIDADIVRLRREAIPSPTLFVEVQRDLPGQIFVGGGLAVPIPVWRRQQGELAVARADRSRVLDERTLVARDVALEVERAFQAEGAQREMSLLMDREVLPAADAAVSLMTEGWRAGKFDLFRLLQTSRDASEARRLYLETLGLLWESSIALDRAVGAP
ncbi:MAG TPA: TolC family protein [Polyangia bacterium]|jgi:cobalt-zinc-cadmium efflux system outer membrane protein